MPLIVALYTVSFSYQSGNGTIGIREGDLSLIVKIGSLISTNLVTQALSFQEEMTI